MQIKFSVVLYCFPPLFIIGLIQFNVYSGFKELDCSSTAEESKFSVGGIITGYVVKAENDWLWLTVSRQSMAKIFILDTSSEPDELSEFEKRYRVGQPVIGRILHVNEPKKLLSLVCRQSGTASIEITKDSRSFEHICEGDIVGGRIKKILPGVSGLLVQIGPHLCGRVHYTEINDQWISDPLSGYNEGQFVKCKVLEISRQMSVHVDLSLRSSVSCRGFPTSVEGQDDL